MTIAWIVTIAFAVFLVAGGAGYEYATRRLTATIPGTRQQMLPRADVSSVSFEQGRQQGYDEALNVIGDDSANGWIVEAIELGRLHPKYVQFAPEEVKQLFPGGNVNLAVFDANYRLDYNTYGLTFSRPNGYDPRMVSKIVWVYDDPKFARAGLKVEGLTPHVVYQTWNKLRASAAAINEQLDTVDALKRESEDER